MTQQQNHPSTEFVIEQLHLLGLGGEHTNLQFTMMLNDHFNRLSPAPKPSQIHAEHYKVVVLSTAHLDQDAIMLLSRAAADPAEQMIFERDSGYLIRLFERDAANGIQHRRLQTNEVLMAIIHWAYHHEFQMIEFHGSAATSESFPTFQW